MKLNRVFIAMVLMVSGWAGGATAASIAPGDIVTVGGTEWAKPHLFINNSWDDINAQCPGGVCSSTSMLNGYALDGWTWASNSVVQDLFNTYTGQNTVSTGSFSATNSTWAPMFVSDFGATINSGGVYDGVYGFSNELYQSGLAYLPFLIDYATDGPYQDIATTGQVSAEAGSYSGYGAWFYQTPQQPSEAPIPATIPLIGLGFAALGYSRRKGKLRS